MLPEKPVRWTITGHRGQLGHALVQQLESEPDCEIACAVDLPEVDVSDAAAVKELIEGPARGSDVVVNAAAMTAVDRCEREPEAARRANAEAPGLLASAAREAGCRFVHVSTDYVFAGDADRPYREDDTPDPRSAYGRSKLEGERRVAAACDEALLVRTSWVFGRGRNFLAAVLDQASKRRTGEAAGPLRVVDDQTGRPTWAVDLAAAIRQLVAKDVAGTVHVANDGQCTWWELARACLDERGFGDVAIDRSATDELDRDAPRPRWSVLDLSKAASLGVELRPWRDAVRAYLSSDDAPPVPPVDSAGAAS